jgi:hypothetical protein
MRISIFITMMLFGLNSHAQANCAKALQAAASCNKVSANEDDDADMLAHMTQDEKDYYQTYRDMGRAFKAYQGSAQGTPLQAKNAQAYADSNAKTFSAKTGYCLRVSRECQDCSPGNAACREAREASNRFTHAADAARQEEANFRKLGNAASDPRFNQGAGGLLEDIPSTPGQGYVRTYKPSP